MASKKRRSGKSPRQGISGNPQRRAEQLAQRQPPFSGGQELAPLALDFRSRTAEEDSLLDMAYALAGGARPSPWWEESHEQILDAARAATWPARLAEVETQACQIVGDEFYQRLNDMPSGLNPPHWLLALVEETGAALRASVADGTADWRQLWALLCGLALTTPPGDTESETAKRAREFFPDIKDPRTTALAEAARAAKLLAGHGLDSGLRYPADGVRPAGGPLLARDAYGSRFLVAAPFSYDGQTPDHWYAWDVDACWVLNVVGAGVFGSAQDALAEWQHAVGPAAAGAELSPTTLETTAELLAPSLRTGPMSDLMEGIEPRPLIREYYRLRQRARALACAALAASEGASPSQSRDDELELVREAFLDWYAARHEDVSPDVADALDVILYQWGTGKYSRYACSPHRIEMTARLIRDQYFPTEANAALRLLPEWTQWCIGQSELSGDFAARSRGAALSEAAALLDDAHELPADLDETSFRRPE